MMKTYLRNWKESPVLIIRPKRSHIFAFISILVLAGTSYAALHADINNDGEVNLEDLAILANKWLNDSNQTYLKADINSDGIVNFEDFADVASEWLNEIYLFPTLSLIRASTAYDADFRELPENVARYEDICIASRPTVWINQQIRKSVLAIDTDLIICSDGESGVLLYTTTDGVNFTKLADISKDQDFVGYYETNDTNRSVKVMPDGNWLLSFGQMTLGGPGKRGHLFRSVDKGLTWTHVLEFERGYAPYWGWCAVSDNEAAVGEYGYRKQSDNPRRVYYSDDYGATWSKIWEPAPEWDYHTHLVAFAPGRTDVIYVSSGDYGAANRARKVEYTPGVGGKRNIANWSEAANSPILERENCPVCAFSDGRYLYLGRDAYLSPILWRLDCNDDSLTCVLDSPEYIDDSNHPYKTLKVGGQLFSMIIHEGVYYAAVRGRGNQIDGGIYVSTDGEHWTCAYRVEGIQGFHNIVGFANGYLWGTFYDKFGVTLYKMSPVRAATVKAMRVERGITNQLDTPESSSFEGGAGGWGPSAYEDLDYAATGLSTDMAKHGTSSYKIVVKDKGYGRADIYSGICPVKPALGDYICASFWVRAAPTKPTGYVGLARIEAVGGQIDTVDGWFNVLRNEGWAQKTLWGRCTDDSFGNGGIRLRIGLRNAGYGGVYSGAVCYVDCAQIVYFNDLHYSGFWQIGGTPRANEAAVGSLVGLGPEFTTTFEWRPELARREWHGNIYIASWTDGKEHIDLYYDHNKSKFVATDGANTATTSRTSSWEHIDSIKFALTNMASDFRLSVLTPLNGVEHVLTDKGGTELGPPVAITFGTDNQRTNYGCGLIANVKHFDLPLTDSEIQRIFDLVETSGR
jgi:hypothetical protein